MQALVAPILTLLSSTGAALTKAGLVQRCELDAEREKRMYFCSVLSRKIVLELTQSSNVLGFMC